MKKSSTALKFFTDRWTMLSFGQQILIGTAVVALLGFSVYFFSLANDDYVVLYSNMSPTDAAATAAKLKEQKEPFRVADNGTTIMVPSGRKNELMLNTATELTEGSVNLGKIPIGISGDLQKEWIKKVNTQTIEEALKGVQGVKAAKVIIAEPEHNVFSDSEEPVKASVMLAVESGYRLQPDTAKTIKNLVAHAVPGLAIENVAIADSNGNALDGPTGLSTVNGQSEADLRQKNFEDRISKKVLAILTPVVGKGNAQVSVTAQLNFDQAEAEINRVIPQGGDAEHPTGVIVSQQTETEHYDGTPKKGEGGPAGVESNTPSYTATNTQDGKNSMYKREITTTNNEISRETKKVLYAPGNVERLTVAVAINKVLTAKETDEIRDLVENAAGLDSARGDSVAIQGYQFAEAIADSGKALADATKDAQQKAFIIQIASLLGVVMLGLAALFIFYTMFKKPAEGEIVEEVEEYGFFDEPEKLLAEAAIPMIEAKLDPEIEHMRESINNMVETDPGEAARVLVTYMKDM